MELRHFRYVIAVAEELNFGRAAERLNMSQPPLSHQIRLLEEELGVKLFERTKRHVQLTEAGIRLVEEARKVLAQVDRAVKVTSKTSQGKIGHLSVGMLWERTIMVESLRILGGRYPDIHVDLHRLSGEEPVRGLMEGRLDIVFALATSHGEPSLIYETLAWEPLIIGLPTGHRLTAADRVPLRALAKEPNIMFQRDRNPGLHDEIIAVCRNAGFTLNAIHEVDSVYSGMALVAAGLGICLFPSAAADVQRSGVVFRHLEGRMPKTESVMMYRRVSPSNVLRVFLDIVRTLSKKKAPARRQESYRN
jgi:DNA-binding transcriptional LysR family regulator